MAPTAYCKQGLRVWEAEGTEDSSMKACCQLRLPYVPQGHKVTIKSWGYSLWVENNTESITWT